MTSSMGKLNTCPVRVADYFDAIALAGCPCRSHDAMPHIPIKMSISLNESEQFTRRSSYGRLQPAVEGHGTRRRVTLERVLEEFGIGGAAAAHTAVAIGRVHLVRSGHGA